MRSRESQTHVLKFLARTLNRFFLVHVEISVMKVTNGKYTESDDSRRNKGNEKNFLAIFVPGNAPLKNLRTFYAIYDFSLAYVRALCMHVCMRASIRLCPGHNILFR